MCFETTLGKEQFIKRWEEYSSSADSDLEVKMQQSEKDGVFSYIAQHYCPAGELKFAFAKAGRSSRVPQVQIKIRQAGGYSILQSERKNDVQSNEIKIFAFISDPQTDLNIYKKLSTEAKLNIYSAYYENCKYAFIFEFFIKNKHVVKLVEQLKSLDVAETGVYKEFVLQTA